MAADQEPLQGKHVCESGQGFSIEIKGQPPEGMTWSPEALAGFDAEAADIQQTCHIQYDWAPCSEACGIKKLRAAIEAIRKANKPDNQNEFDSNNQLASQED